MTKRNVSRRPKKTPRQPTAKVIILPELSPDPAWGHFTPASFHELGDELHKRLVDSRDYLLDAADPSDRDAYSASDSELLSGLGLLRAAMLTLEDLRGRVERPKGSEVQS